MRTKYNYTPNDYDLYFDYEDIPSNIDLHDAISLSSQLQEVMPLTKVVHLHFNQTNKEYSQFVNIQTKLTLNSSEVKLI